MIRVPKDAAAPTFGDTFKVSFRRWITSSGADRKEWVRRRNAAARTAGTNQRQRAAARYDQARAHAQHVRTPAAHRAAAPAVTEDRTERAVRRLFTVQVWLAWFAVVGYLVGFAVLVGIVGFVVWLLVS